MPFVFNANNRLISRYDGSNFQEEVLTLSGADGISVTVDSTKFTISGNQAALSGALAAQIAAGDANAVSSGSAALTAYSGYAESAFVNADGDTMTGFLTLNADPTSALHASTKQYVDVAAAAAAASGTANASLVVEEDNVAVYSGAVKLDFGHAIAVSSGSGEAVVAVDESEFTDVVFLTGDQIIAGNKTFQNDVIVQGNLAVSGLLLTTEELLVEDHVVTLNATVTGTPSLNAAVKVERGTSTDALLLWNETADRWEVGLSGSTSPIVSSSDLNAASGSLASQIAAGDANAVASGIAYADQVGADAVASGEAYADAVGAAAVSSGSAALTAYSGYAEGAFVNTSGDAMTGFLTLNADPSSNLHAATKQYVDSQVSAASGYMIVQEANATIYSGAVALDFGAGFDVTSGTGEAQIALDLTETNAVLTVGNQLISGTKTFAAPIVVASGAEPATISGTGAEGEIRWSDDYLYVCVATNSWKRVALAQF